MAPAATQTTVQLIQKQEDELMAAIEAIGFPDDGDAAAYARRGDLIAALRRLRKQRELIEDPDKYLERIDSRAVGLLDLARKPYTSPDDAARYRDEARLLMDQSREIFLKKSEVPKLTPASVKSLAKLTKDLAALAASRKSMVEKIDGAVDVVSAILTLIAKAIPLAALAA